MDFEPSATAKDYVSRVRAFMREHVLPAEAAYDAHVEETAKGGDWRTWRVPPVMEELKARARAAGLWNMFIQDPKLGPGLSIVDYAQIAEETGRSFIGPEVFNCSAPDTGNMETLWRYGSDAQKEQWLKPLLAGEIRSVFSMTEPAVASSDATNMQSTAVVEGDEIVLNGVKWWSSGVGDPRCRLSIFMAHTPDPARDRHQQHSMVLVPMDAPGLTILRMLPVFGRYDAPHGHGEVRYDNVRVPLSNVLVGPGEGFAIAQGRLGPGRIHHCMRCIGAAERALDLTAERGMKRIAFGKPIIDLGGNRERLADNRIAIDQARLLTLYAAWKMDKVGNRAAMAEISAIKVVAPNVMQRVVDDGIQMFGAAGMSNDDTPLADLFAKARALRLADGPDEVHRGVIARIELRKHGANR
jgi:alkylation response protein AidB-like acyl-CoA dehydrogenase